MTQSMTGFARAEEKLNWATIGCEIRSVNQRFLEPSFRLPEILRGHEPKLREFLRKKISRGKLDCTFRISNDSDDNNTLIIDENLARNLILAAKQVADLTGTEDSLHPRDILKWPGILKQEEGDPEILAQATLRVFESTVEQLIVARKREGEGLKNLIQQRLDSIDQVIVDARKLLPKILLAQKSRLMEKLEQISTELDPSRLEQEIVFLAQKADVDEELSRLETHVLEVRRVLESEEAVGRRLDFLMQELNREANTLSSKAIAIDTSFQSVELKVLIEQMREQIQNIE